MEDGNSVIVVADVSGKGAGAAIIMANLQAAIRLGIHLSDKLADFVTRINDLIYNNTSESEFITFFMAIWDPRTKVLYYVNAGHNPPVFIDNENKITLLGATGLILGVLPGQVYEEKYVRVHKNDVLLIYTDGLDEARNDKDEFYGLTESRKCFQKINTLTQKALQHFLRMTFSLSVTGFLSTMM